MDKRLGPVVKRIEAILSQIQYKDWDFEVGASGSTIWIQTSFVAKSVKTGVPCVQLCRRWLIEPGMSAAEIVRTALKAVLTAEEHEARELFRYRGEALHSPHFELIW